MANAVTMGLDSARRSAGVSPAGPGASLPRSGKTPNIPLYPSAPRRQRSDRSEAAP